MSKKQPDDNSESTSLDRQLEMIEEVLDKLEREDCPLEESLQLFEKGIKLTRAAQAALSSAEQRVQVLLEDGTPTGESLVNSGEPD